MGMIGRWIDERCKAEPEVMRRVLNRKFGRLSHFFDGDHKCGCLVGSWGLESGRTNGYEYNWPMEKQPVRVGYAVDNLTRFCSPRHDGERKRPDAFVIRVLKQRIRKSLGIAPENRPVRNVGRLVGALSKDPQ